MPLSGQPCSGWDPAEAVPAATAEWERISPRFALDLERGNMDPAWPALSATALAFLLGRAGVTSAQRGFPSTCIKNDVAAKADSDGFAAAVAFSPLDECRPRPVLRARLLARGRRAGAPPTQPTTSGRRAG